MRTHLAACIATLLVHGGVQEESKELTIELELAALIEKTNALETFHVIYDIESTSEEAPGEMSVEVVYQAPGTGCVLMSSEEGDHEVWLVGNRMHYQLNGPWQSSDVPDPSAATRAVDEMLPVGGAVEPGVLLQLGILRRGDSAAFNLNLSPAVFSRAAVLEWLRDMAGDPSEVTLDGDRLAWNYSGASVLVSRKTGFIEAIDVATDKGEAHVRLRSLRTDETLDESLVTLPPEARQGEVVAEVTRNMAAVLPDVARKEALRRVIAGEPERREQDRRAWRSFLDVMHREKMGIRYPAWLDGLRKEVATRASSLREKRESDETPESLAKLREQAAEARVGLEKTLDKEQDHYLEQLPSNDEYAELFEIEGEVVRELYDEIVRQPILTHYDEEMKAVVDE